MAHPVRRVNLPQHPTSARAARSFVAATMSGWGLADADLLDCLRLLTSELVTNAVVHARSPAVLQLARGGGVIRVEVRDRARSQPSARTAGPWATSGRGLAMVDALALRWGNFTTEDGDKVVWFELPDAGSRPVIV